MLLGNEDRGVFLRKIFFDRGILNSDYKNDVDFIGSLIKGG
jgi:hypothetical protein